MQGFRTGLKRAAPEAHVNFFAPLLTIPLPPVPIEFGSDPFPGGWGMLGNDELGDCTIAGADHTIMYDLKLKGQGVRFTKLDAEDDYGAFGYKPGVPSTDAGADMLTVAQYWQTTGMRDCNDARYKITDFASIIGSQAGKPDLDHVYSCTYLFKAAGLGISLSDANIQQFLDGVPWTPDDNATEYHFVPVIQRGPKGLGIVTWGKGPSWGGSWLTEEFFKANCKEAVVYLFDANDPNANLFAEAA